MKKHLTFSIAAIGLSALVAEAQEVKVKGDVRIREEYIDEEGKDSRNRLRLRARVGIDAVVNPTVKANVRMASGSEDPVSTNQTLGDFFGKKGLNLDIASVTWTPANLGGLNFTGGKMANPFDTISKDLIWDSDLTPEGIAANLSTGDDAFKITLNAGGFQMVERSADDETLLFGGTLAADSKLGEGMNLRIGGGLFQYENVEGYDLAEDDSGTQKSFGNSKVDEKDPADPTGKTVLNSTYASEYSVAEAFLKLGLDVGVPLAVYADYAVNTEADKDDTGYLFGLTLGAAKDPGSLELDYNYRSLEKDAVFGAFTDSDSLGGGTNGEGHRLQLLYQVAKNTAASATYFMQTKDPDGKDIDFDRFQLDFLVKF
jgi:Putative porin